MLGAGTAPSNDAEHEELHEDEDDLLVEPRITKTNETVTTS
jgi:hypothetical protein